jgi:hypothetical protein
VSPIIRSVRTDKLLTRHNEKAWLNAWPFFRCEAQLTRW